MMKNILFMVLILCLVLAACHSSSGRYVYDIIPLDKARQDDLEDDFDRALKYFSGLNPSKDGYYFVYQRDVEFDEPGVCLFFYDKGDSITICQSRKKTSCRRYDFKSMDISVEGIESALPLFPKTEMTGVYGRLRITGYKKEGETKHFFMSYLMDACNYYYQKRHLPVDSTCKDKWKQAVEENFEQFIFNGKIFNRLEYLVNRLFIKEKIEGWREANLISEEEYEDFMRKRQEKMSKLEREYEELLNMSVADSASQP